MSDGGEKPFAATTARRKRAVREGNVARSTELAGVVAFGASLAAACACVPRIGDAFGGLLRTAVSLGGSRPAPSEGVHPTAVLWVVGGLALGPAAAAAVAGSAFGIWQGGGLHVTGVRLDPKRLDVFAGCKRMLGAQGFVGAAKAATALVAALCALVPLGYDVLAAGVALRSPAALAQIAGAAALRACGAAIVVGVAFGGIDYALARRRWLHGLKMSLEEFKRDSKENDGDPQARSRRKSLHRDLVRGAIARTREAHFVVVNPTHVAVALRYAPPDVPVPEILVRALDDAALRVRAIARDANVPIVEDAVLARLLYATSTRSRVIAPETYVAVAQVVADLARAGLLT